MPRAGWLEVRAPRARARLVDGTQLWSASDYLGGLFARAMQEGDAAIE